MPALAPRSLGAGSALGKALLGLLALTLPVAPADAGGQGVWEMSLDGSNRRCRLTLSLDTLGDWYSARFPAGCRRALPVLVSVQAWRDVDGRVELLDREGQEALTFKPLGKDAETGFRAKAPDGKTYRLELASRSPAQVEAAISPAPPKLVPQSTPIDPATAPPPSTIPGIYALDRYTEREVCRLRLERPLGGAADPVPIRILQGCRDAGIMAFEPVSWRYDAGRLTITARRGHTVSLVSEQAGEWRRDPAVGAVLVLRRLEGEDSRRSAETQ